MIDKKNSLDAEKLADIVDEYLHWRKVNPHIKGGENYLKRLHSAAKSKAGEGDALSMLKRIVGEWTENNTLFSWTAGEAETLIEKLEKEALPRHEVGFSIGQRVHYDGQGLGTIKLAENAREKKSREESGHRISNGSASRPDWFIAFDNGNSLWLNEKNITPAPLPTEEVPKPNQRRIT